jgi:phosphoribosyl 1,2-cyclic phosphodiesterase
VLTDLGFVFPELEELLPTLDGVYIESNYDPHMLQVGPYPPRLKRRIAGDGGHISNAQAADLLAEFTDGRLVWATLSHLSQTNNTPDLAMRQARNRLGPERTIHLAGRFDVSEVWTL